MIPVSDKARDINDNLVFSGSFLNTDSIHIYPAFLSAQKSWADVALVNSNGWLFYEKSTGRYLIGSREKLIDHTLPGNLIALDRNKCVITSEGNIDFGAKFDLVKFNGAGKVIHSLDSGTVDLDAVFALDFYFSDEALQIMADEVRMMPSLKAVNTNNDLIKRGMNDLLGVNAAAQLKEEADIFGPTRSISKDFSYKLLLNDVKFRWNASTSSFRSTGKIGIGFIGAQPMNVYVDGYIELQRRRSGDMIDIYLKADKSTWYYFSYFKGVMMTQSGNNEYNTKISTLKLNDRKDPKSSIRVPYTYMISVEDRLPKFLRRMTRDEEEEPDNFEDLIR
jgi:hypothetical protein